MVSKAETPGTIEPGVLYSLDEAKQRTRMSNHAFRSARQNGLRVLYVGRRAFVMGDDIISHIQETAATTR
jgi:hypothetical protein